MKREPRVREGRDIPLTDLGRRDPNHHQDEKVSKRKMGNPNARGGLRQKFGRLNLTIPPQKNAPTTKGKNGADREREDGNRSCGEKRKEKLWGTPVRLVTTLRKRTEREGENHRGV